MHSQTYECLVCATRYIYFIVVLNAEANNILGLGRYIDNNMVMTCF